ncbi:hypothetical protein [Lacinutrix sp. Hel_I_90]|uniref:hypothetical protein n=1 Tax=Lacinutrix sp. Hel_I_90 TaxID=1249999 RepID=UPI0005C8129E|nr:hypothetical protein [Lacinutrix sp. Hel_I_90]
MKTILITIATTILISITGIAQSKTFIPYWAKSYDESEIEGNRPYNSSGQPTGEWEYFYNRLGSYRYATFNYDTYIYKDLDYNKVTEMIGKLDKNFNKTGIWKIYHKYGSDKIAESGMYSNGYKEGTWTEYDLRGNTVGTTNYVKGSREGTRIKLKKTDSGATIKTTEAWLNDKQTGPYKEEFLIEDKVILMKTADYENHLIVGDEITYYEDGNIATKTTYNGAYDASIIKYYHENGEIKAIENLKEGYMRDGKFTIYHKNGEVYTIQDYSDNKLLNIITTNDSSGKSLDKGTLSNGNGIQFNYDAEGNLSEKLKFEDGLKTHSSQFQNGELVYEEFYDDKGNVIRWIGYQDTVKMVEFNMGKNSNFYTKISYLNGKKSQEETLTSKGLIFIDYEDEVVKEKRFHFRSRDVVSKKEIYENGKLIEEINYDKN